MGVNRILELVGRGHEDPGFIACVTKQTRDAVELELWRLRDRGLVSKRKVGLSFYVRSRKGGTQCRPVRKPRAAKRASRSKRSTSQQPRKSKMAAKKGTTTKRKPQQQQSTAKAGQQGAGMAKTGKTAARKKPNPSR